MVKKKRVCCSFQLVTAELLSYWWWLLLNKLSLLLLKRIHCCNFFKGRVNSSTSTDRNMIFESFWYFDASPACKLLAVSKLNKLPGGKGIAVNSIFLMMMITLDTHDYTDIYKDDDIDYNDISPVLSIHNWSTEGEYRLDHLNWQIWCRYLDVSSK